MKKLSTSPAKWAIICYIFANSVYLFSQAHMVVDSNPPIAFSGYLFLLLESLFSCLPWFLVGGSLGYCFKARSTRHRKDLIIAFIGIVLSLFLVEGAFSQYISSSRLTKAVLAIEKMDAEELDNFVLTSELKDNKFALGAVCLNPKTTPETLMKVVVKKDPELHKKMRSKSKIMGANERGYAVMRLIISHPNVTPELLGDIAKSSEPYVLGDIASNSKTPQHILENLHATKDDYSNYSYLIEWGLSKNINIPTHILESLANSRDEYTLRNLDFNTATSPRVREKILIRLEKQDYD